MEEGVKLVGEIEARLFWSEAFVVDEHWSSHGGLDTSARRSEMAFFDDLVRAGLCRRCKQFGDISVEFGNACEKILVGTDGDAGGMTYSKS